MKVSESAAGRRAERIRPQAKRVRVSDFGEDGLLARILPDLSRGKSVLVGAGDDCAIVQNPSRRDLIVLKTDCVVAGVHFLPRTNPVDVGWKAMMRPLSDFAATSAVPEFALITLVISKESNINWVQNLYRGLNKAARRFGVSIVGGETSGSKGPAVISVSIVGFVEKNRWVSRTGGRSGDDLFVTGRLGYSIKAKHLNFIPRINESRWLTENFSIHAMMDLSDGLGADLPRLAVASKVGFQIDAGCLPLNRGATIDNAIADGEDYELLFAISPRDRARLERGWGRRFPKLLLTHIGKLNRKSKIGNRKFPRGYVHFQ
jgi:thiamine-monophosphate kinase